MIQSAFFIVFGISICCFRRSAVSTTNSQAISISTTCRALKAWRLLQWFSSCVPSCLSWVVLFTHWITSFVSDRAIRESLMLRYLLYLSTGCPRYIFTAFTSYAALPTRFLFAAELKLLEFSDLFFVLIFNVICQRKLSPGSRRWSHWPLLGSLLWLLTLSFELQFALFLLSSAAYLSQSGGTYLSLWQLIFCKLVSNSFLPTCLDMFLCSKRLPLYSAPQKC